MSLSADGNFVFQDQAMSCLTAVCPLQDQEKKIKGQANGLVQTRLVPDFPK